jgi:FMN phosphatase YigB (HAD superfamily)
MPPPLPKPIILFDLDGTLADITHRRHLVEGEKTDAKWRAFYAACSADLVNEAVAHIFRSLYYSENWDEERKYEIWIVSGRSNEVKKETRAWLRKHDLIPTKLLMRQAGDHQPDHKLKRSWLIDGTIPKVRVLCVFDDRDSVVAMWRSEGLTCFQVAAGNF